MCNRYECGYILQVKQRMRNREQYQDFLKCLSLFSEDIISKQELINLMMDSLSRHPDLQVCWPVLTLELCRTLQSDVLEHRLPFYQNTVAGTFSCCYSKGLLML